jgi:hypothetical protein
MPYHRLALLLFDHTQHMVLGSIETDQDREFCAFLSKHVATFRGSRPTTTWTEIEPKKWEISPAAGVKLSVFCPERLVAEGELPKEQPLVSLGSLPVLDPESLTNELVYELRNDTEARAKLKRLRSFAHEQYMNKPLSYIQDDLETRILDYKRAAKKWGIRTLESSLTISGTETVLSAACAGLVSAITGVPLAQAAAFGAVAVLGTTVVRVLIGRKHFALGQSQDPVSYLVDIQEAVGDQ